jgi:TPR repeat protein
MQLIDDDKHPAPNKPGPGNLPPSAPPAPSALDQRANPESQYALGEKYEFGEGVALDYAKAAMWYKRAAGQGHAQAKEKLKLPWLNGELEAIKSLPSLTTLNGFGFKMYGNTDFDPETDSCMMTHYLVFLFIPVLPIARYRVINWGDGSYRFLGKGKLRTMDKVHIGVAILAFFLLMLGMRRR